MGLQFRCLPHLLWLGATLFCCVTSFHPSASFAETDAAAADRWMSREEKRDALHEMVRQGLADLGKSPVEIETQVAEWNDMDRVRADLMEQDEDERGAAAAAKPKTAAAAKPKVTEVTKKGLGNYDKRDAMMEKIGDMLPGFAGSAVKIFTTNWKNATPKQIGKAIGDMVVPIQAAVLSFIPVIGPMLAGVWSGIWSLVSSLWLEKEEESPMEKMIKEAMKQMREEMDAKMATFINNLVQGEMSRNRYVCDKYAMISENFTENYVAGGEKLNDTFRLQMTMFLDNCDNFLQDTYTGLQSQQYPEALWQSSAVAALAQLAFLKDATDTGRILQLPHRFIANYFLQIESTLRNQFKMYFDGIPQRAKKVKAKPYSLEEIESCRIQGHLLYTDRSLYLYGTPRKFIARDNQSFHLDSDDLTMKDPKTKKPLAYDHIQIFANIQEQPRYDVPEEDYARLNCFMGPIFTRAHQENFRVSVSFIPGHSYEIRVVYSFSHKDLEYNIDKKEYGGSWEKDGKWNPKKAILKSTQDGNLVIGVVHDPDVDHHDPLFETDWGTTLLLCDGNLWPLNEETLENEPCWRTEERKYANYDRGNFYEGGKFTIDRVGIYNFEGASTGPRAEGSITVEVERRINYGRWEDLIFIVGIELVVRNEMPD